MKSNVIRWIMIMMALVGISLGLSYPSIGGAEGYLLDLDYTKGGTPAKEDKWYYDDEGEIVSYQDTTIKVGVEHGQIVKNVTPPKGKTKKNVKHETWVIRIRISDASQLRTAVSKDTYSGRGRAKAEDMAKSKNAVVAMNGDFFKYENDVGYVIRQGEFIRDATRNKRKRIFDMLLIDSEGDFHVIDSAETEYINDYIQECILDSGKTVFNTFNLGPELVRNGQVQPVKDSECARQSTYEWCYPQQRIAIVQTGHLEYAIVEVYGRTDYTAGLTLQEFAQFVAEQCPNAICAYNLDGGGSTNLYLKDKRICKTPGIRDITDIIYFASAEE